MSPEANPAHLLSPERLAAIRIPVEIYLGAQESRPGYVETDMRDVADLLAHLDAREAQVRQALAGLLLHSLEKLSTTDPYRILGEACNRSVRNAAQILGIDL